MSESRLSSLRREGCRDKRCSDVVVVGADASVFRLLGAGERAMPAGPALDEEEEEIGDELRLRL